MEVEGKQLLARHREGESLLVHHPDAVGKTVGNVEVVGGEEDDLVLLVSQVEQQLHDARLGRIVEEGGGLVEEDERCLLCYSFGNHHLLSLSVAEPRHLALSKGRHAHSSYGVGHNLLILLVKGAPEVGVGHAPHPYDVGDGKVLEVGTLGEHNADGLGHLALVERHDGLSVEQHVTAQRGLEAGKGAQQRALPYSVATHKADEHAALHLGIQPFGYYLLAKPFAIAYGEVSQFKYHQSTV